MNINALMLREAARTICRSFDWRIEGRPPDSWMRIQERLETIANGAPALRNHGSKCFADQIKGFENIEDNLG